MAWNLVNLSICNFSQWNPFSMNRTKENLSLFCLIYKHSSAYPAKVGMFKIHPKVPECMSDEAKAFIMNCFTPNPDDRATAAELLMDSFLRSHPRKKAKAVQEADSKDFLNAGKPSSHICLKFLQRPAKTCCDPWSLTRLVKNITMSKQALMCLCSRIPTQPLRSNLHLCGGHWFAFRFHRPVRLPGPEVGCVHQQNGWNFWKSTQQQLLVVSLLLITLNLTLTSACLGFRTWLSYIHPSFFV